MPKPCPNCVRFHYGECSAATKQCYVCSGFGHLDRYCPNRRNNIRRVKGEPLAGTRSWCKLHGLNNDPELKKRVLAALKTNPGSAIYVDGVCIHAGNERHFETGETMMSRGRQLEERMTRDRARTRSPLGPSKWPRLPPAQRGHGGGREPSARHIERFESSMLIDTLRSL